MNNTRRLVTLSTALLVSLALPCAAQQKLLPAQSALTFTAKQMGVPINGRFKKFDAQVSFDAAKLASSKVAFIVDMGSASIGIPEMDIELPKAIWFNVAKFPQASFVSSSFKSLGSGHYEVSGLLSIKGQAQHVTAPLTMTHDGTSTVVNGVLLIKRLVFKIGDGDWADTSMIANDVQVMFKLALSGIDKPKAESGQPESIH
ncbi:MAG: YceI family protein [Betaproteobacteria bacterium]|nr:YceI family protein [Betaproteobacteria bacterium]NCS60664.1 YceI family protein [Rhodoferax sp.]PIZ23956.1 MAG: polyisoprenoid-binding protein [Comamonadaceae bacterium CG_4_10_14_0_8_um_filter_57_29]PJC12945.1 MAG: polyisoprenoid-binding protein [Comamonadaceae bacterium CG_4_9_14_0_8_um_filter_57_21]